MITKMSYRQDNLKRAKNIRSLFLYLAIGIIFYFSYGFILSAGYSLFSFAVVPLWRIENRIKDGAVATFSLFKSKEFLAIENERLSGELDSARLKLESISSLQRENEDLMLEMGREKIPEAKSVIAAVLSGPNIPPYDNLIIDVGKDQEVTVGDRVIYRPNIVIGEVVQVFSKSSKVRLYSASGMQTDVLLPVAEQIHAVARGFGGGNFFIELPSSIKLSEGMELLIPGSGIYILGVIDYIQVDTITSSQKVLIRYPVNIKNARFVHVIKSAGNEYLE